MGRKAHHKLSNPNTRDSREILYDVSGLGNPLVDILTVVDDSFLSANGLNRGIMHLIDKERKDILIQTLKGRGYGIAESAGSETNSIDKANLNPSGTGLVVKAGVDSKTGLVIEAGGSCPNTIATLALLDVRTALAGGIGHDDYGRIFSEKIREKGISSYLRKGPADTGICIVLITPDKERTMNTYLGACRNFSRGDITAEMIEKSRFFYFTGYMWDTTNQKGAVTSAIEIAKKNGVKIVFDIADPFAVDRHRSDFLKIIEDSADIVFANAMEADILYDTRGQKDISTAVRQMGRLCEIAVVKNSADDTHISYSGEMVKIPSFRTEVQDTTGAGDNFAAGFLYGLINKFEPEKCCTIASFVASKTIEKIGAQAPVDIKKQLEEVL